MRVFYVFVKEHRFNSNPRIQDHTWNTQANKTRVIRTSASHTHAHKRIARVYPNAHCTV